MNRKDVLPDGWDYAFKKSNQRHINHPFFFEAPRVKSCRGGNQCPLWSKGFCLSSWCILRFPTPEDLMEFVENQSSN